MAQEVLMADDIRAKDAAILEKRAAEVQRGGARAAVLGVNDGLVSTLCIVLAVAAAGAAPDAVLLAGFAGLIAGAFSMAAGEWISVKSQVELFQGILTDLKAMMVHDKPLLTENLETSLAGSGYDAKTAQLASVDMSRQEDKFIDVYATQVIGMNPDELGSPWIAAGSSFVLFTFGAFAPLAPWLFTNGMFAVFLSIIFTGIGGLVVGAYVAYSSGKSMSYGALRQLGIIVFAAVVTYGVGYLFGVAVN
jgi:VIT1/CCC1 family predicted Fe2+/Mn2+ transporter